MDLTKESSSLTLFGKGAYFIYTNEISHTVHKSEVDFAPEASRQSPINTFHSVIDLCICGCLHVGVLTSLLYTADPQGLKIPFSTSA